MSLLEVCGLSFAYGNTPVFRDVSFSVDAGQIFCLVGPNGCGKTTLEHCILTHLKPSHGKVLVNGKDVRDYSVRALAAELAYVPQSHTRSFPYRTADVVAMGLARTHRFGQSDAGDRAAALAVMERLGIGHLADAAYTTLSGGELQTALLARALLQGSRMLVLDEPTAHLDVGRSLDLVHTLTALAAERGVAVLLSTHDLNQPLQLEDEGADVRMALMSEGRLGESGLPSALLGAGAIESQYAVQSCILPFTANRERHALATWKE